MDIKINNLTNQKGSISIMVIILLAAILPIMWLIVDGGLLLNARERATASAQEAARAGQVVSKGSLEGREEDRDIISACESFVNNAQCYIDNDQLKVTVTMQPQSVFLHFKSISGHASAKLLNNNDNNE